MTGAELELRSAEQGRATLLPVRAQPGARRNAVAGLWNGRLKLAVSAPSADGRANEKLRALLAESLGLRPSSVELVRGHSSRSKVFRIALPPEETRARLEPFLSP